MRRNTARQAMPMSIEEIFLKRAYADTIFFLSESFSHARAYVNIFLMLGFYIFQFPVIVALESLILWKLKWGPFRQSLFDSAAMNFVSFLGLMLGMGPLITSHGPFGLLLFSTYSIMVEGVVLILLERHSAKKAGATVVLANVATFFLLGVESLSIVLGLVKL